MLLTVVLTDFMKTPPTLQDCPACGQRVFAGARVCTGCGRTIVHRFQRDHSEPVPCADCGVGTEFDALGGITIDACSRCGSIWFDDGELESLPSELSEAELARDALAVVKSRRTFAATSDYTVRYFPCPVCKQAMNRRNYRDVSGIILHRCSGHGTWVDWPNAVRLLTLFAENRIGDLERRAREASVERARLQVADAEMARFRAAAEMQEMAAERCVQRQYRGLQWAILMLLDFFS
jgi:Zn-finger nucleic acid-binding protein/ribosomal protein L32